MELGLFVMYSVPRSQIAGYVKTTIRAKCENLKSMELGPL